MSGLALPRVDGVRGAPSTRAARSVEELPGVGVEVGERAMVRSALNCTSMRPKRSRVAVATASTCVCSATSVRTKSPPVSSTTACPVSGFLSDNTTCAPSAAKLCAMAAPVAMATLS